MAVTRVHSSDSQVFVNDQRIPLIQSLNISTNKDVTPLRELGEYHVVDRILNSNQTTELSINTIISTGASGVDPFYTFQEQEAGFLSTTNFDFKAKDNAGESLISGAYLTAYTLDGSVGEIVKGATTYEADTITFNTGNFLTDADRTTDAINNFNVFRPEDIVITTTTKNIFGDALPTNEGVSSSGLYIQNFSLNVGVSRDSINRIGTRIPQFRYPTLPAEGNLNFSVIKNQATGIDLSALVLDSGTIKIDLKDNAKNSIMSFSTSGCSLLSLAESLEEGGNATLDFSYNFSIQN